MKSTALVTLLALAACGPAEPESAANKASRLDREISERAAAFNAQIENELSQVEQRLDREASDALNSLNAAAPDAAEANAADEAAPAPATNRAAAPANRTPARR